MVHTSAQPVEPAEFCPSTLGITKGTLPLIWSASTSLSHLAKKLFTPKLKEAVRENACASPVHPKRSSLCGQSVGTSRKLPRCPHWILCCNWLINGLEEVNVPVGFISEYSVTAVKFSGLISPG